MLPHRLRQRSIEQALHMLSLRLFPPGQSSINNEAMFQCKQCDKFFTWVGSASATLVNWLRGEPLSDFGRPYIRAMQAHACWAVAADCILAGLPVPE